MRLISTRLAPAPSGLPLGPPLTGFQSVPTPGGGRARQGRLWVAGRALETPALFPVLSLLTGPPGLPRNGATHKWLKRQLLFTAPRPAILAEALHFTDWQFTPRNLREWFPHSGGSATVRTLAYWLRAGFAEMDLPPQPGPLCFLDSGGFRLLFNRDVDLAPFGYAPTPASILQLQLDYGADLVASLDYPVPPGLNPSEAATRIEASIQNARTLMRLLYDDGRTDPTGKQPFPILAIHGTTPAQIRAGLLRLLGLLAADGYLTRPFGLGIGSLVPLRIGGQGLAIVRLVQAVMDTLYGPDTPPGFDPARIPVHAFGISGDLIPVLAHLGVDTFDSAAYVKAASVLDWIDPITWSPVPFLRRRALDCDCPACQGLTPPQLAALQTALRGAKILGAAARLDLPAGAHRMTTKSDIYGLIAYHNLSLYDAEIARVRRAISLGATERHLAAFCQVHPRTAPLRAAVAGGAPVPVPVEESAVGPGRTLARDPAAFDLATRPGYRPPPGVDRLLILACAGTKPYHESRSHHAVWTALQAVAGADLSRCHKVTLSGLYGPVPLELENDPAVLGYDYILGRHATAQQALVLARLVAYLQAHAPTYGRVVAYVTVPAYRRVIDAAFACVRADHPTWPPLILAPLRPHGTGTKDLLTRAHLAELSRALYPDRLPAAPPVQLSLFPPVLDQLPV